MHWTVLLVFPWLWLMMQSIAAALIGSLAYLLLLLAHELGHAAMAHWRGATVESITLSGLHGQTSHAYPRNELDDILIAWSGVGAQLLVLLLALTSRYFLQDLDSPLISFIAGPVLMVFTLWNLFLMIVALLPIGPMDGYRAWRVIPYLRNSLHRRRRSRKVVRLDPERRRALQKKSEQMASDVIQKLGKKK